MKRKLAKRGLESVRDLLEHRPRRYEEAAPEVRIAALGGADEVVIAGEVLHGEVIPVKRVRGSRKAFQEFIDALVSEPRDAPSLRVGIAHASAPERAVELEKMVRDLRPQAHIDIETSLGALLGAHAGPGTVGFFWFTDSAGPRVVLRPRSRRRGRRLHVRERARHSRR